MRSPHKPEALIGGVDWISKKWLLETFMAAENLRWDDPWLQSLDLEYHNIDPARGLFFGLKPAKRIGEWNNLVRQKDATFTPPADTRASGRGACRRFFSQGKAALRDQLGFDRLREPRFSRDGRPVQKPTSREVELRYGKAAARRPAGAFAEPREPKIEISCRTGARP